MKKYEILCVVLFALGVALLGLALSMAHGAVDKDPQPFEYRITLPDQKVEVWMRTPGYKAKVWDSDQKPGEPQKFEVPFGDQKLRFDLDRERDHGDIRPEH